MNPEAFRRRVLEVLEQEASQPEGWFWLSFASAEGFRGACIVRGRGLATAHLEARTRGIVPAGGVETVGIGPMMGELPEAWVNRLLTREESEALEREMDALDGNGTSGT